MSPARLCLSLLLLTAFPCGACEPTNSEAARKDVEKAFLAKSLSNIADKYAGSQRVQVILENEHDDESPTVHLEFKSIAELSKWFFEKHEHSEHLFVPTPAICTAEGCKYPLPKVTLHHGIYLLGFETTNAGGCTSLTQLHLYWG